jgi:hypothetical protein
MSNCPQQRGHIQKLAILRQPIPLDTTGLTHYLLARLLGTFGPGKPQIAT